jgi:hypothetical protein
MRLRRIGRNLLLPEGKAGLTLHRHAAISARATSAESLEKSPAGLASSNLRGQAFRLPLSAVGRATPHRRTGRASLAQGLARSGSGSPTELTADSTDAVASGQTNAAGRGWRALAQAERIDVPPTFSRSRSAVKRLPESWFLTARASALRWPTSTTSALPRVTAV